ncbi:HAMP domain-containing sensor histidine kinase [Oscillospiraceae bacterium PP1C4]
MKISLRLKLIISYSLLSLFLVLSLLLVANTLLERQFQNYIQKQQEQKNNDIVQVVVKEYEKRGEPSQDFFYSLGQNALNQGIVFMIGDASGKDLFCMSCIENMQCENMIEYMSQTMQGLYPNFNGKYQEKTYPVIANGTNHGTVTLGYYGPFYYNDADIHFIKVLNQIFLAVALVFLFVAFLFGYFMANRISKPLKSVISKTKDIEQGRYSDRIGFTSSTHEIAELIECVNFLAGSLETQQLTKKRMARDYAHEFRTPLAALQSNLEAMIDGIFEPTAERLESCRAEILRLSRMVCDINKIVELESNGLTLQKQSFDFSELLRQVLSTFEQQIYQKNINLNLSIVSCDIFADKDKISQVLVNLLSNAVKYTENDGKIDIAVKEYADVLTFSIADNGVGIAKEDLPFIFDHLFRTDLSRTRDTGGAGIGLSVVKAIITSHGGTITVKSELQKGSKFVIELKKQ